MYAKLCSLENLELAFKKARKRKTLKPYVQEFEKNLSQNLQQLHQELIDKTYQPLPLRTFILRDPKTRKISVSNFRDRVVHHAVVNILEPIFEQQFIHDSYANRIGKGVLAALKRFDCFKRKVSKNGTPVNNAKKKNTVRGFVLKADVKHYFDTVDHDKLLEVVGKKVRDEDALELIGKIINNHVRKTAGKGMPLGNLTSQFFANVFLNEFDWFVKHTIKAEYYIRYVDDFIILHHSRKKLQRWKKVINDYLKKELLLELHPQKSCIRPLHRGIDFLGFKCFYHHKLVRKRNIRKMIAKIELFKELYANKKITAQDVLETLHGWNAYAMHANTYKLRQRLTTMIKQELQQRTILSVSGEHQ